jgi:glycosyltransferase involved in cell wall biosynthesis
MKGYASDKKKMTATLMQLSDGTPGIVGRFVKNISPYFELNISLPTLTSIAPIILDVTVDEHQAPNDHRPFGVLLDSASVLVDRSGTLSSESAGMNSLELSVADLSELHEEELRINQFEAWMGALHETAQQRNLRMEDDFAKVRGPHSADLQSWLVENADKYDAILVQGIPFDVVPSTVESLSRLPKHPSLITLPHFHGDDRFYHWRRYYDSFAKADATLVFSPSIAENLGPSAKCVVVPGGGVRTDEGASADSSRLFRSIYTGSDPYFLVLGRKTPSKGYLLTLSAHQKLRQAGSKVGLVLIGPDEDGLPITGDAVCYLGRQPREVIRGALGGCIGVVTMSRSESFGIVLCEAWLFGKPVIANRTCYSFRELVRNGENGLLVSTIDELTLAMKRLLDDGKEVVRMGEAGFADAVGLYTWERVADSCLRALEMA